MDALLRRLVPPIVREAFRSPTGPDWEGVYDDFHDVPRSGPGFEGDVWLHACQRNLAEVRRTLASGGGIPPHLADADALVMLAGGSAPGRWTVLDFGGGLGATYLAFRAAVPGIALRYHVIESPRLASEGARAFADDPGVKFDAAIPTEMQSLDVAHVRSALQYMEEWEEVLGRLAALHPRFILLRKLSAGDVPTFASGQRTVSGSVIPYRFLNEAEVVRVLARAGFAVRARAPDGPLPDMRNLPAKYRLAHTLTLLFARSEPHVERSV